MCIFRIFLSALVILLCDDLNAQALSPLAPLPDAEIVLSNAAELGKRLFYEPKLSANNQRSCASCHPLDSGGMDGKVRAEALDGISALRNTPTLFNIAFNYFYNWDGLVTTLEAHTEKVLLNPKVMAATWPELLDKLQADADYAQAFAQVYPDGLTKVNVINALTSFEHSLITPNARFDRFLKGDQHVLSNDEQEGYRLFKDLGCVACHQGSNIGGNLFQKFGVFGTPKGGSKMLDAGRYQVTGNDRDTGVFRVPSLRNVAITAPYFHDGRAATLEDAVDIMAENQLGQVLQSKQRGSLVKFLNTLTGEYQGKLLTGTRQPKP